MAVDVKVQPAVAVKLPHMAHERRSAAISRNQPQSAAISRNQPQSVAIGRNRPPITALISQRAHLSHKCHRNQPQSAAHHSARTCRTSAIAAKMLGWSAVSGSQ